jgi:hypothetical protein
LVQIAPTPAAFRSAIEAYRFDEATVELARRELLLVGNAHGLCASREPALLYELTRALDARELAFEWSHDELGALLDDFLHSGRFDLHALWALPDNAEVFAADGRFTAGHVALLERLQGEGTLEKVIPFDRLDSDPPPAQEVRTTQMAARLSTQWNRDVPLLAVVGAAHLATMAPLLDADTAMLDYGGLVQMPTAVLTFAVPEGPPAVVPGR